MNRIESALRRITTDLDGLGVRYALIGGFAVSARTEPRFTRDVDLAVLVDSDAAAEALVRALTDRGYRLRSLVEQYNADRLATVRLAGPGPGPDSALVMVDLMFASAGIEPEIVAAAEALEILPGLQMPVATAGHLVVTKLLARDDASRPQDGADLLALARALTTADRAGARAAAQLVMDRGFVRARDLPNLLEAYLAT